MSNQIFNSMEIDAIGEIMNISLGSSATAVSNMLDSRVNITTPTVTIVNAEDFELGDMEPAVGVEIKYVSGLEGSNIMLLKYRDVKVIVDILMGMETPDDEFELNDLSLSAVCEVMNQMMGAASTALSDFLGRMVNISTPQTFDGNNVEELRKVRFPVSMGPIVVVRFALTIGETLKSEFMNVMSVELARELIAGFGLSEGEAAPEPDSADADQALTQEQIEAMMEGGVSAPPPAPAPAPAGDGPALTQEQIEAMMGGGASEPQPTPMPQTAPQPAPQPPMPQAAPQPAPQPAMPQAAPMPMQQPAAQMPMQQPVGQMPMQPPVGQMPMQPPAGQMPMQQPQQASAQMPAGYPGYPGYPPYYGWPQPDGSYAPPPGYYPAPGGWGNLPPATNEGRLVRTKPNELPTLEDGTRLSEEQGQNLDLIMGVPLEVAVEIGRTRKKVKEILSLSKGSLVVLDKLAGDQVDVYVNGKCIARGDVVVIDDNFGIRVNEILRRPGIEDLT